MANLIQFPAVYAPLSSKSGAIGLGFIYIGDVDTDPKVLGNRINVTIREENGTETVIPPASQPLTLGAGGVFVYNGAPVMVLVDGSYAMTIDTSAGVQAYYFPQVDPISGTSVPLTGASDPTPNPVGGIVYVKDVSGIFELHYMDDAGTITQITSNGALVLPEIFPFPVQVSTPATVADTMTVYSKTIAGNLELFVLDPNGREIQLTSDGAAQAGDGAVTEIGGSTITVDASANGAILIFNTATQVFVTLPEQATSALNTGYYFLIENRGSGEVKLVLEGTDTLDGISLLQRPDLATTIYLQVAGSPNAWATIGNYWLPTSVVNTTLSAPPGATPGVGDVYIVGPAATGDWVGQENNFAIHVGSDVYEFQNPTDSIVLYAENSASWVGWTGTAWIGFGFGGDYPGLIFPGAATYAVSTIDGGNLVVFNEPTAVTITFPETATTITPLAFECSVINLGVGSVTIAFEGADTHTGVRVVQNTKNPTTVKKLVDGAPNEWAIMNNTYLVDTIVSWTTTSPTGTPSVAAISYVNGVGTGVWTGANRDYAIHVGGGVYDFKKPVIRYQGFYNSQNNKRETLDTSNGAIYASN